MTGDNKIETVVAEKTNEFGTARVIRTEFDVDYQVGNLIGTERSVSFQFETHYIDAEKPYRGLGQREADVMRRLADW